MAWKPALHGYGTAARAAVRHHHRSGYGTGDRLPSGVHVPCPVLAVISPAHGQGKVLKEFHRTSNIKSLCVMCSY
ncbi:hypothetical protein ACP4OV_013216 [Aristida adscensionis]